MNSTARRSIAKLPLGDQNPRMDVTDDDTQKSALNRQAKIARWIFLLAAIYGIPVLGIWFFHTPAMVGRASLQQPEIYYGFAGLGVAWQIVFLLIASDPLRYRPLMLISAICEKFFFAGMLVVLLIRHIAQPHWIPPAVIDGSLGMAFLFAYFITGQASKEST